MSDPLPNDTTIGEIIRQTSNLTADQVDKVLEYQKLHNVRFGEAAVALGFTRREDVMWALSQQFQYAYTPHSNENVSHELVVSRNPFSDESEFFRNIRTNLLSSVFSQEKKCALAIVSPEVGDGKSFFAANLAVSLSQLGGRTLLVDADMRSPRQHEIFGIKDTSFGLSTFLTGRAQNCLVRPVQELPSLYVMPVGTVPPNPLELLQRPPFYGMIKDLLTKFDHVLIDTPAASHGSDGRVVAAQCGAALIVGRKNRSSFNGTRALLESLSKVGVNVVGAVMNEH